jgi:hypothetical protein
MLASLVCAAAGELARATAAHAAAVINVLLNGILLILKFADDPQPES